MMEMSTMYVVAGLVALAVGLMLVSCANLDTECPAKRKCMGKMVIDSCKETGIYNMEMDDGDSSDESSDED